MTDNDVLFIDGVAEEREHSFATQSAVLRNGAKITRLNEASPIVIFNFLYEDADFRIRFTASRWGEDRRPSDTWRVNFGHDLTHPSDERRSQLNDVALANIARNIREALLAWPPLKAEASVKGAHVIFGLAGWLTSRKSLFRSTE
jgi:hypothetical protein